MTAGAQLQRLEASLVELVEVLSRESAEADALQAAWSACDAAWGATEPLVRDAADAATRDALQRCTRLQALARDAAARVHASTGTSIERTRKARRTLEAGALSERKGISCDVRG